MPSFQQHLQTLDLWERFPAIRSIPTGIALTFDDGPDPDATPRILDVLAEAGARAVFFMVGEQVESHPDVARRVAGEGHVVALHGFRHIEHADLGAAVREDMERGLAAIAEVTGVTPDLFRPSYGRFTEESYMAARQMKLETVYWSGWGNDWEPIPAERIADTAIRDLTPGTILLLHDSARYASRPSAAPTAEALPAILAAMEERGLAAVNLPGAE